MEKLFVVGPRHHGKGPILYAWHPSSLYLASVGTNREVFIFECRGKLVERIMPHSEGPVIGLEWYHTGRRLAILHGGSPGNIFLWHVDSKILTIVDYFPSMDPVMMRWSYFGMMLAIGTSKGEVAMYNSNTQEIMTANVRHKKRVTCGDWSHDGKFAFGSDDRQITIIAADGSTLGQIKVKSRPTNIKFGSNDEDRDNMVSVSMDRKTIMLYNLDDAENALELAFEAKYGHVVAFHWLRDPNSGRNGYLMVGFSAGYLVVISTHVSEIGSEQFCARFFKDYLQDVARSPVHCKVALCGETVVKIVSMEGENGEWEMEYSSEKLESTLGDLKWSPDGRQVSVSSSKGHLYVFEIDADSKQATDLTVVEVLSRRVRRMEFCAYGAVVAVLFISMLAWFLQSSAFELFMIMTFQSTTL